MGTCTGPSTRCHGSVAPASQPAELLLWLVGRTPPAGQVLPRPTASTLSNVTLPLSLLPVTVALPQRGPRELDPFALSLRPDRSMSTYKETVSAHTCIAGRPGASGADR